MREPYGVMGGLEEGYKVLSHVPDPGLEDLDPPLVVLGILCCHTCWLGDFGALGLRGASDEGIVVGRWHSRLLNRSAWHPGPCWGRGSGWGGRDGEARQGVRGLHALQTGLQGRKGGGMDECVAATQAGQQRQRGGRWVEASKVQEPSQVWKYGSPILTLMAPSMETLGKRTIHSKGL